MVVHGDSYFLVVGKRKVLSFSFFVLSIADWPITKKENSHFGQYQNKYVGISSLELNI